MLNKILLVLILVLAFLFRFNNLSWGAPFFFHPDERNIVYAIQRLHFPQNLNPHFFAYGSLPIYVIYFSGVISNLFLHVLKVQRTLDIFSLSFENAIFIGRFYSALLSFLSIFLTIGIFKKISKTSYLTLITWMMATSVGFIQFAHFATFEMWLTFFSLLLFYFLLIFYEQKKLIFLIILAVSLGLLLSIKISSLTFFILPLFVIFKINEHRAKNIFVFLIISIVTCVITSPFYILDFPAFKSDILYESNVATGALPVFYTGQFFGTFPVIFQFLRVYPFLINPLLTILFIPSLIYITYHGIKTKNFFYYLLFTIYYLLFLSQSFLFVKWTRYIVPTIPFIYLIISITLLDLLNKLHKNKYYHFTSMFIFIGTSLVSLIFSISFFSVHLTPDSRIHASLWASQNIPKNSAMLSEIYDLGIVPFNQYFPNIELFNFYDLDSSFTSDGGRLSSRNHDSSEVSALEHKLEKTNYLILPSQRILKNRITNIKKFPNGSKFYKQLFSGQFGYKKIYQTPCDFFCKITYMGEPIFSIEETANVFDRPMVFIFENLNFKH